MRLASSRATMQFYMTPLLLLLALLVCVSASVENGKPVQSRFVEVVEEARSSFNSSMADRSNDHWNEHAVDNPEEIASLVDTSIRNSSARRELGYFSCATGNPIDDCWRCDPQWQRHRKRLANCGIGFGRNAVGGRDGKYYVK